MQRFVKSICLIMIALVFMSGCGNRLLESSAESTEEKSNSKVATSTRKVTMKDEKMLQFEKADSTDRKDKVEKKKTTNNKKKRTKNEAPTYTTEKMSGDFMAKEALNMREGPSTDFQSLGSLSPYQKAVATEKAIFNGDTWYKITSGDVTGWSSAKLLVAYEKKEAEDQKVVKQTKEKETPAQKPAKNPADQPAEKKVKKKSKPTNTSATPTGAEKKVIDLTNAERKNAGLSALKVDNQAVASARAKSNDMSTNGYFSHTSPTYGSIDEQLQKFGVSFRAWGENIAQGQSSAEQVVQAWMNSPSHQANILNENMTHIGVGHEANGNYWTQQFISK